MFKKIIEFIHKKQWPHIALGLLGNSSFLIGSVAFLFEDPWKRIGVWLFIVGAAGMFIDSVGRAAVRAYEAAKESKN